MKRASTTSNGNPKAQQGNAAEGLLRGPGMHTVPPGFNSFLKEGIDYFSSSPGGFDLTQVPAGPALHATTLQVQCCSKDGAGCNCPKCKKAMAGTGEEQVSVMDDQSTEESTAEEDGAEEAPGLDSETADAKEQSTADLIVEDSATELSEGQMRKTPFLQQLRAELCRTLDPVLAKAGQSTEGCPYLNYWLEQYQEKDAAHIEQTVKKYAPDSADAKSAEEYISIVTQRALRAAEIWASTGKITGVPEEGSGMVPGEASSPEGDSEETKGSGVQAKARNGGVKKTSDPLSIQKQLGEGQPLAPGVRSRMESAFGTSFSHVQTHTDATATTLSNNVNARAFTVGNHIAFGNNEYHPGTLLGDALIAHELAHTVQQSGAAASVEKLESGNERYNALEKDADQTALGVVGRLWGNESTGVDSLSQNVVSNLRSGLRLQRCCTATKPPPTVTITETQKATPQNCGGMQWGVKFGLSGAKTSTDGWIVQQVSETFDVKDCDGAAIDVKEHTKKLVAGGFKTTPGGDPVTLVTDPAFWPLSEAWSVDKGKVFMGNSPFLHNADTYTISPMGPNTKGKISIKGSVDYFDCADLPSQFASNKTPAKGLMVARPPITLSGGSGAKDHNLEIEWNCCPGAKPGEEKTKVVSKTP